MEPETIGSHLIFLYESMSRKGLVKAESANCRCPEPTIRCCWACPGQNKTKETIILTDIVL